jgi:uncharacterized protein (UPF0297 family)
MKMIPILLLIGGAIIGAIVALYWRELLSWMQRAIEKIKQIAKGVLEGAKTFIARMHDGIKNIAKYYSRDMITNEYEETVTKKAVNESDVPEELRAKIRLQMDVEFDTTDEFLAKLTA